MGIENLFKSSAPPPVAQAPGRSDTDIAAARQRARKRLSGGRRSTILGGRSGGAETVARKSLLGE